ncbi:MAG: bifunctional diaminohydroxyphosphoribosylaminopyrimidine deaminase/5-amino-6-(5-phosphoribosylamino)uracil reductase RibD [Proteobacteria bacterium]|nr:bifunctional diaminohydroxyphosphoribosylaminopyrimidine deaminase/5-amino-6-(5-phosphoribosylamino)uracil reductase RibD [Pseudomonadota bacterium]MCZ6781760.1 bifunctional diaminohydroxyphosphoribosylaminopyrimidine deaminase/5-amino-6-(5-phosphoribosylamino)uracil reductase RibD [Pseudomonadota bacterium]
MTPDEAMRRALARARTALGRTFPNPSVGAVVYRGSRLLGSGATRPPGGAHAEIVALRQAERRFGKPLLRGASMAVTLEPCCHRGRTGPCVEALIEAGLGRVYVGCVDPHPEVSGRGVRRLRRAGVETRVGVLGDRCREQHRGFLSVWERRRPFVTLKLASSLDGRIATVSGASRWITGPEARRRVHDLRRRVDGIMVGSGTALADDPDLSARRGDRVIHRPVRILVDSRLRVPTRARLYRGHDGGARTWVLHAHGARGAGRLAGAGAASIPVARRGAHLDLRAGLRALARKGLTTLLVEGGGQLAAALLRAGLIDEIHWFLAPLLLGAEGRPAVGALAVRRLESAARLEDVTVRRVGRDLHLHGRVAARGEKGRSR